MDEVVYLDLRATNDRMVCKQDDLYSGDVSSFDAYSIYSPIHCSVCKEEIGRFYHSTTNSLDGVRQRHLVFEDLVLCYDLDSCKKVQPSKSLFSN